MQAILICWCCPKYLNFCCALKGYAIFVLQLHPAICLWKMNICLAIFNKHQEERIVLFQCLTWRERKTYLCFWTHHKVWWFLMKTCGFINIHWCLHHSMDCSLAYVKRRIFVTCLLSMVTFTHLNPLIAELNPIWNLLALLGAHHIFHVSRIRVNGRTNTLFPNVMYT